MSHDTDKVKGRPIGNLLYTREAAASLEKTKAELEVSDPESEDKALGVLLPKPEHTVERPQDESTDESQSR